MGLGAFKGGSPVVRGYVVVLFLSPAAAYFPCLFCLQQMVSALWEFGSSGSGQVGIHGHRALGTGHWVLGQA